MSNEKAIKRKQKKIIKKYGGRSVTPFSFIKPIPTTLCQTLDSVPIIVAGTMLDIVTTGGIGTITICSVSAVGALTSLVYTAGTALDVIENISGDANYINTARQNFKCTPQISSVLQKMEKKLKKSFNKASAPSASNQVKKNFLKLAAEIQEDVKTLTPLFSITSGGSYNLGTDNYVFTLAEKLIEPKKKQLTILDNGVRIVTEAKETVKTEVKKEKQHPRPKGSFGL